MKLEIEVAPPHQGTTFPTLLRPTDYLVQVL